MKKLMATITGITLIAASSYGVMIQEGTKELVLEGAYDFQSVAGSALALDAKVGYFVMDGIQVGGLVGVSDNDFTTDWRIGAFAEYNVDLGEPIVPFVGASVGLVRTDPDVGSSEDTLFLGAEAGAKYFIAENIAVSLSYQFLWADEDVFADNGDRDDTDHSIQLGMRFFF